MRHSQSIRGDQDTGGTGAAASVRRLATPTAITAHSSSTEEKGEKKKAHQCQEGWNGPQKSVSHPIFTAIPPKVIASRSPIAPLTVLLKAEARREVISKSLVVCKPKEYDCCEGY
mmetsp:Transcript_74911/g.86984  ORF Transcript_74911/g.86984 Transcript_74911/m.86984 type:complete len:115 (+) Transcript_74911:310-654(+)